MKKIGIYGGTFDPVHHGHLILARTALENLGLARIVFVPAIVSPHKLSGAASAPDARLEMLSAAIEGEPEFGLNAIELTRPPPSYTVDTMEALREQNPEADFYYLVGEDNVARLTSWHRFEDLSRLVQFVVLARAGEKSIHPYPVVRQQLDISATDIRKRVASGRSVRYLVPAAVEKIIRDRQLYRETER